MAAFTDQVRRFEAQQAPPDRHGYRGEVPLPDDQPLAKVLTALRAQIRDFMQGLDTAEREAACLEAVAALRAAGHEDVDTSTLPIVTSLPGPDFRTRQPSEKRRSELLGAVAAWKWIDLQDALRGVGSTAVDDLLATVTGLLFVAHNKLGGEICTLYELSERQEAEARTWWTARSGHEAKRRLREPLRKRLVMHALELRGSKANRSEAVRATLRHFADKPGLPEARTLHEWLRAAGWARGSKPSEK